MAGVSSRILFPCIHNDETSLILAVSYARENNSRLIILKTYRLNEQTTSSSYKRNQTVKEYLEEVITNQFSRIIEKLGDDCVEYDLILEMGFLSDHLMNVITQHKIKTILTDRHSHQDMRLLKKEIQRMGVNVVSLNSKQLDNPFTPS